MKIEVENEDRERVKALGRAVAEVEEHVRVLAEKGFAVTMSVQMYGSNSNPFRVALPSGKYSVNARTTVQYVEIEP